MDGNRELSDGVRVGIDLDDLGDIHVSGSRDVPSTVTGSLPARVILGAQVAIGVEVKRVAGVNAVAEVSFVECSEDFHLMRI